MSPYNRSTYRYTPILAWMLQPNITISPLFGKVLFVLFDVLSGYLIYVMLMSEKTGQVRSLQCAFMWLLNPLPIVVSCRGNAESIMSFLVLLSLRLFQQNRIILGAVVYALSVHVKIYPLTYGVALYLYYSRNNEEGGQRLTLQWIQEKLRPSKENTTLVGVFLFTFVILTGKCYQR